MSKQENKVWVLRTKEEELKQRAESAEAELLRTREALAEIQTACDGIALHIKTNVHSINEGLVYRLMALGQMVAEANKAALSKAPQPQEEAKHE